MKDTNPLANESGVIVMVREKVGHARQAQAVAQAMALPYQIVDHRDPNAIAKMTAASHVIAAGRQSISAARKAARRGDGVTCVLQPVQWRPADFDVIWSPAHDRHAPTWLFRPPEVRLFTLTAPSLTPSPKKAPWVVPAELRRPLVAVLIGGPTRIHRMRGDEIDELATRLRAFALAHDVSLLIATSRRTPRGAVETLRRALRDVPHLCVDARQPEETGIVDPVATFLSVCDAAVVTTDSFAMLSEAAAFGAPILGWRLPSGRSKFDALHEGLIAHGAMRWFDGTLPLWSYPPLNPAHEIATAIRGRMGLPPAPSTATSDGV